MKIFLSYSWSNTKEANELDELFRSQGIELVRDIKDVKYKGDIIGFMKEVKTSDFVITLISDSYLKSPNCMYEVLQLISDDNYKSRILPVVIDGTKVYKSVDLIYYVTYWQDEYETLKAATEGVKPENMAEIAKEIKLHTLINLSVGTYIKDLQKMLTKTYGEMKAEGFKELLDEIRKSRLAGGDARFALTHDKVININIEKIEINKFKTKIGVNNGMVTNVKTVNGNFNLNSPQISGKGNNVDINYGNKRMINQSGKNNRYFESNSGTMNIGGDDE